MLISLLDCNQTLQNCCKDYSLMNLFIIIKRFMNIMQIAIPIILMIGCIISFVKLSTNPDEKNGIKKVTNKFVAAVIVFLIPVIVSAIMNLAPLSFSFSSCWKEINTYSEVMHANNNTTVSETNEETTKLLENSSNYEKGKKKESTSEDSNDESIDDSNSTGSKKGKEIVQYAKKFVGKEYVWGGSWNGEEPYKGTDCSGFVQGVFRHFGISLSRSTSSQWADKKKYTIVNNSNIQPGDLVMYKGHVGILTGNGNEIIHAKGRKWGVVIDKDYRKCSQHAILGIIRIKGVE